MAGVRFTAQPADQTPTINVKTGMVQIKPGTAGNGQRVLIDEISVSFDGVNNTDEPVLVEGELFSSAATGGGAMATGEFTKDDLQITDGLNTVATKGDTAFGTMTKKCFGERVQPQSGYTWQAPFGKPIIVPANAFFVLSVNMAVAVKTKARVRGEE